MDNTYPLRLVIVRHGTTISNLKGVLVGIIDDPLTKEFKEEYQALLQQFEFPEVDLLFRSPRLRCLETMRITYPGREAKVIDGLHEVHFGEYEGVEVSEAFKLLQEQCNMETKAFFHRDPKFKFTEGESFGQAGDRFIAAIDEVVDIAYKARARTVGVFTHGLVIDLFLQRSVSPPMTPEQLFIPNGFGLALDMDYNDWKQNKVATLHSLLPQGAERPPLSESPYAKLYEG